MYLSIEKSTLHFGNFSRRNCSNSLLPALPCFELMYAIEDARTARSSILIPEVSASAKVGGSLNLRRKREVSSEPSVPFTSWTSRPRGERSPERSPKIFL